MRNYIWTGLIGILALMSCEKIIPLELPDRASRLVINSILNPDSLVRIYVYGSQALLAPRGVSVIDNAAIVLSEYGQLIDSIAFDPQSKSYLSRNFHPKPGRFYELIVSAPGFEEVSASCQVPFAVPILHAEAKDSAGIDEYGDYYSQFKVQFTDPEGTKDFYGLVGTVPRTRLRWKSSQPGQPARYDTLYDEVDIYMYSTISPVEDTYDNGVVFTDDLFDGKTYELIINYYPSQWSSNSIKDPRRRQLTLLLNHTDAFYYEYNRKLVKHLRNQNGGLFAGEPVSVPNNITNGYGIFSGYSQTKVEIPLQE